MSKKSIIAFILALLSALLLYSFFESYWLKVKKIELKDTDVPEAFVGKKIVFVADLHLGFLFSKKRTEALVAKINSLKPDIIIIGGDIIDRNQKYTGSRFTELKKLEASMAKLGVLGNHDNVVNRTLILNEMQGAGITPLENQAEWFWLNSTSTGTSSSQKIKIGGVGDLWTSFPDIEPTTAGINKDDFVILVSHNPDFGPDIKNDLVDLVLAGHTHAGQMTLFGKLAIFKSKYGQKFRYGMVDLGNLKEYITSGVGTTVLPFRFFARPEIVLISLNK